MLIIVNFIIRFRTEFHIISFVKSIIIGYINFIFSFFGNIGKVFAKSFHIK